MRATFYDFTRRCWIIRSEIGGRSLQMSYLTKREFEMADLKRDYELLENKLRNNVRESV